VIKFIEILVNKRSKDQNEKTKTRKNLKLKSFLQL